MAGLCKCVIRRLPVYDRNYTCSANSATFAESTIGQSLCLALLVDVAKKSNVQTP